MDKIIELERSMTPLGQGQINKVVDSNDDDNKRMRESSGIIKDNNKFVCFIYLLGRDHLSLGIIEEIMGNIKNEKIEYIYTNGWLAQYAKDVVNRLKL